MRGRFLVGLAVVVTALGLSAVPAGANSSGGGGTFHCDQTVNGGTISQNITVPNNATCILNNVTVTGNVNANTNSYFEANGSTIHGNINGYQSLTLYVWGNSVVDGTVSGSYTPQVFVYDSTVGKNIGAFNASAPGYGHFQVCGTTVGREIGAAFMGPDILIGDPAAGCAGNTTQTNDILVAYNKADSEVHVIGNTAVAGDINIYNNTGVGDFQIHANNAPYGDIFCSGNTGSTFSGTGNGTVGDAAGGQCTATKITGMDADE